MPIKLPSFRARRDVYPADLWTKCPTCETMIFNKQLDKAMRVCPTCGHHFRLSAATRLLQMIDAGTWAEHDAGLQSVDRLGFVDQKSYPDRLAAAQAATGMRDAAVWGTASMGGIRSARASSAARVTFSPTTAPIEPPMNPKSMTQIDTGRPSTRPIPRTAASRRPVASWAATTRSG